MAKWFYLTDGQPSGPIEPAALKQLAASGGLKPTDKVRREDIGEWYLAEQVKGLFAAVQNQAKSSPAAVTALPVEARAAKENQTTITSPVRAKSNTQTPRLIHDTRLLVLALSGVGVIVIVSTVWLYSTRHSGNTAQTNRVQPLAVAATGNDARQKIDAPHDVKQSRSEGSSSIIAGQKSKAADTSPSGPEQLENDLIKRLEQREYETKVDAIAVIFQFQGGNNCLVAVKDLDGKLVGKKGGFAARNFVFKVDRLNQLVFEDNDSVFDHRAHATAKVIDSSNIEVTGTFKTAPPLSVTLNKAVFHFTEELSPSKREP